MAKGRGRLSAIDLLPEECTETISWASQELAKRERTQLDIYAEFKQKLIAVQGEFGLAFDIPSFTAFNRHSLRLAQMSRRMETTREITKAISDRFDAETSDDLTLIAAEAIKTLVWEIVEGAGEKGLAPKGAMELANALRSAVAAQSVSTSRRLVVQKEFNERAEKAIEKAAKAAGLTGDVVAQLRRDFLGVRQPAPEAKSE